MSFTLEPLVISDNAWPNSNSELGINSYRPHPGDLSKFLAFKGPTYLGAGYHEQYNNPMLAAPPADDQGGTVYFGNGADRDDIAATMRLIDMVDPPGAPKRFVIYAAESKKPGEEQYLRQLRFVSHLAMVYEFHAVREREDSQLPVQTVTLEEAVWLFIQSERKEWGTFFASSPKLDGLFGGDGHYAREELSFGLQVENTDGVFRLWSRAWLVHK